MKICSTCGEEKQDDAFPSKGLRCKKCAARATSKWYAQKATNETARRAIQKQRNDWHQNKLRTDAAYRETGICPRTGFKFDLSPHTEHHRNPFSPSIDRVDGAKGYIKGNIQIVCSWYNIAKNEYSDAQMLKFCQAVIDAAHKSGV